MPRDDDRPFGARVRIDRRRFVAAAAGGVALATDSAMLTGCHGVRREGDDDRDGELPGLSHDEHAILQLASLAPSGHNTQPWRVRVLSPGRWEISADPSRLLPAVDPTQRETVLSIGAFLENLIVAAGHYGLNAQWDERAPSTNGTALATLALAKGARRVADLDAMRRRRVVRKGILTTKMRAADLQFLMEPSPEQCHFFPASSPQGRYLAEGTVEANRVQASRDPAQEELADWIRWSDSDAAARRDGLTAESMEIGGLAGWYVRHFYDRAHATGTQFRDRTVAMVEEQVSQLGGWLVLAGDGDAPGTLLDTGRLLERVFLRARARMIAIHPMTQLLEEARWQGQVAAALGLRATVHFILRVGYLEEYPEPVSMRRPVSDFVRT